MKNSKQSKQAATPEEKLKSMSKKEARQYQESGQLFRDVLRAKYGFIDDIGHDAKDYKVTVDLSLGQFTKLLFIAGDDKCNLGQALGKFMRTKGASKQLDCWRSRADEHNTPD